MIDDMSKNENPENAVDEIPQRKISDKWLVYTLIVVIIAFALVFFIPQYFKPDTIDELHEKNMQGKISKDKGYVYEGYSFVFYDDLWHTQIASELQQFNIPFHYSPRDVSHIQPVGVINYSNLDRYENFFMTFDPTDSDLSYIGVSIGEADRIFIEAFGKGVIAACIKNETSACQDRPIVNCNSTDAPVFYFSSEKETNVLYLNNCAIVTGEKEELFKATDRMLFDLLGIMR